MFQYVRLENILQHVNIFSLKYINLVDLSPININLSASSSFICNQDVHLFRDVLNVPRVL